MLRCFDARRLEETFVKRKMSPILVSSNYIEWGAVQTIRINVTAMLNLQVGSLIGWDLGHTLRWDAMKNHENKRWNKILEESEDLEDGKSDGGRWLRENLSSQRNDNHSLILYMKNKPKFPVVGLTNGTWFEPARFDESKSKKCVQIERESINNRGMTRIK